MKHRLIGLLAACGALGATVSSEAAPVLARPALTLALSDPCTALKGNRWIAYVEPLSKKYTSAEFWDFRTDVINGPAINVLALEPFPNVTGPGPSGTLDWGRAAVTKFTHCVNYQGAARLYAAWAEEPIYDVKLSADGQTATITGTNTRTDTTDLKGWAARAPN
jgi:hypothetical protein